MPNNSQAQSGELRCSVPHDENQPQLLVTKMLPKHLAPVQIQTFPGNPNPSTMSSQQDSFLEL